jgi:hypothetical protein
MQYHESREVAYCAVLSASLPPQSQAVGHTGDRLPYSPRFSVNLAVREERPIADPITRIATGSLSYVGKREDDAGGVAAVILTGMCSGESADRARLQVLVRESGLSKCLRN